MATSNLQPVDGSEFSSISSTVMTLEERARIGLEGELRFSEQIQTFADLLINAALTKYQGNQCKAAAALGMHRNTLGRRIDEMLERNALRASLRHSDYKKLPRSVR
jgi:DNA-binding NtrC family response regulator